MSFDLPVPTNWKLTKLSDLGEVNRGRSRHRPRDAEHLYGGIYPFVQTGDIKASGGRIFNYTQTYSEAGLAQSRLWPKDTMCITIAANIAETGILQFPACFPDSVIGFIADESKCNVNFVEYMFRLLRSKIQAQATGSVQDNINLQTLERLLFPIPNLSVQNKIAKILGDLDNKITLNRQINQTLEAMAQALFKSWFVDFEPVKAKMSALAVGGSADDANLAAMSAISGKTTEQLLTLKTTHPDQFQQLYTTADLFPFEMVDSELGEIPKGWEVKAFGDVVDKYIDNRGKTPPLVDDGIPLLEVKHLTETSAFPNLKADKKISEDTYNTWFRAHVKEKDILISTVGTIGRTSFVKDTNLAIAQNVLGLRFSEKVTPEYMFYLIKDSHFQHGVNSRLVITVQSSIKRKDLNTISLLVPNNNIVMHFSSKISDNLNAQFSLYKEIEFLIDLRDALLPKLLAGELLCIGIYTSFWYN